MQTIFDLVLDPFESTPFQWFWNMAQSALHRGHKLTIPPVRAHGKVWNEVFTGIEKVSFARWWKPGHRKARADHPDEQVSVDYGIFCLMGPSAISILVAPRE